MEYRTQNGLEVCGKQSLEISTLVLRSGESLSLNVLPPRLLENSALSIGLIGYDSGKLSFYWTTYFH